MRHCYRGRGVFRLRALVEKTTPISSDDTFAIYSASETQDVEIEQLVYFCASVLWRASVMEWCLEGETYGPIRLGPYQDKSGVSFSAKRNFQRMRQSMRCCPGLKHPLSRFHFLIPFASRKGTVIAFISRAFPL